MTWERTAGASSAAPPERVWEALLDGRRWSLWNPGVDWMTVEGALEPGGLLTMKPKGAPQTAFRIEAVQPGRLLALAVRFGPVATMRLRWELAPEAGGTTIVQTVGISGPLAGMLLRRAAQRIADALPANLARLAVRAVALAPA
ncbi:MAG TPA: SRPBCC family protein [Candidatus Elarobacter sp.]|nr:SRPBCC family protein [Candidatus Elarobacter sp.]HEV2737332.1 SRPBCC family protein [Candidatus Elarobacter sp.]